MQQGQCRRRRPGSGSLQPLQRSVGPRAGLRWTADLPPQDQTRSGSDPSRSAQSKGFVSWPSSALAFHQRGPRVSLRPLAEGMALRRASPSSLRPDFRVNPWMPLMAHDGRQRAMTLVTRRVKRTADVLRTIRAPQEIGPPTGSATRRRPGDSSECRWGYCTTGILSGVMTSPNLARAASSRAISAAAISCSTTGVSATCVP